MFIKNTWYVAAEPQEIGRQPFARKICGEDIVFWRMEDGTAVAMEDRCCHRRLPLRKGVVTGDRLQCYYHGLEFDGAGACQHVPGQNTVPPDAKVRTYPLVEKYNWLWIWVGDPALADESKIVPYPWKDSDDWGSKGTYFHVKCDYRLIVDNLLDLTHLAFVHASTIGNQAVAEAAKIRTLREDGSVTVARWTVQEPPPPTYQKAGGFAPDQLVDRWQIIEWRPPGFVRLFTGASPDGAEGNEFGFTDIETPTPEGGLGLRNLNAVTPETETTCHYFWNQCQDAQPANDQFTEMVFQQIYTAFHQDWEVFEIQQENWDDQPVIDTIQDAGAIAARQLIDRLMAEEGAGSAAVAAE